MTCSAQAILPGNRTSQRVGISNNAGLAKWPIDAEKCFRFWAQNGASCMTCIRTCPFNKGPGTIHDMTGWIIRRTPRFNKVFLWMDDLFGFGKRTSAARYWLENSSRNGPGRIRTPSHEHPQSLPPDKKPPSPKPRMNTGRRQTP
ncbi:MAG: hypothetical protein HYY65_06910 [Candidatus Tectomicrobia bacterium]|uniref:Reductive dehalogenase subunit A n=1 Tax=Tectimicrobiota bacterium TaxID=2528274 RepID=A0A932GQ09_UNCTE|nr:hypothetical protein [Candidatus Tectomicrobia bacterium]